MTDSNDQVYVEIYEDASGEIANCMGPMSRTKAERTERGASINLDHANWSMRIVDQPTEAGQ